MPKIAMFKISDEDDRNGYSIRELVQNTEWTEVSQEDMDLLDKHVGRYGTTLERYIVVRQLKTVEIEQFIEKAELQEWKDAAWKKQQEELKAEKEASAKEEKIQQLKEELEKLEGKKSDA